ncbi:MAG: SH3 domain-containing protein, partial [Oscillospiraceae bacterium]|nr:SH3 domain-containing protein [Oscillospiraceae bacterium]
MRKQIVSLALVLVLAAGLAPMASASRESPIDKHIITGFVNQGKQISVVNWQENDRPVSVEDYPDLPEKVLVYLDDEPEAVELPVGWRSVGLNSDPEDTFYDQLSPQWDETAYTLDRGLDYLRDAPYVGVFFEPGEEASLMSVTGTTYETSVYEFLTKTKGLNAAAACGIMANIQKESSFYPNNLQGSYEKKLGYTDATYTAAVDNGSYTNFVHDSAGYGLCQWTYWSRKQGLLNYARSKGVSIADLQMQLEYMFSSGEMSSAVYNRLKSVENSAEGAYQAASCFCLEYEKPANMETQAAIRGNLAKNTYWPQYGGGPIDCTCSTDYAGTYICTSKTTLNIRSGHGTSYPSLGLIGKGEEVWVSKASGLSDSDWAHVSYNGIEGLASMQYLEKKPTARPAVRSWISRTGMGEKDTGSAKYGVNYYVCY